MGTIAFDETKQLAEIHGMSAEARGLLAHHFGNSLTVVIGYIALAQVNTHDPTVMESLVQAREAAEHLVQDLERMHCTATTTVSTAKDAKGTTR